MSFLSKLNIVKAAQNKFIDNIIDNAEKWLKDLDLDHDGKKDIEEEILPALRQLGNSLKQATSAVDAVKLNRAIQSAKKLAEAANELAEISKEVLDTEQAKQALEGATNAIKTALKFFEDAIAHQAAKSTK